MHIRSAYSGWSVAVATVSKSSMADGRSSSSSARSSTASASIGISRTGTTSAPEGNSGTALSTAAASSRSSLSGRSRERLRSDQVDHAGRGSRHRARPGALSVGATRSACVERARLRRQIHGIQMGLEMREGKSIQIMLSGADADGTALAPGSGEAGGRGAVGRARAAPVPLKARGRVR